MQKSCVDGSEHSVGAPLMTRSEWRDLVRFASTIGDLSSGRVRIFLRWVRLDIDGSLRAMSARAMRRGHLGLRRRRGRERPSARRRHHPSWPRPIRLDLDRGLLGGRDFPGRPQVAQQVGRPWAARPLGRLAGHPRSRPVGPVSVLDQGPGDRRWSTTGHAQGCIAGPGSRRLDLRPASVVARELAKRRSRSDGGARAVRFVPCPRRSVTAWPGGLALADRRPRIRFEVRAHGQGWRSLSIPERG
jgi:hypothetical protein